MKIKRFILGAYETNCYLLQADESASECLIIDAGQQPWQLLNFLNDHKLQPRAIVLTHGHADHIAGLSQLSSGYPGIKVYIGKLDAPMLTDAELNLSAMMASPIKAAADILVEEGDIIDQAGIKLDVLHVPGHTPGSISLYARKQGIVFTGDSLFAQSIGRTDLPGGSITELTEGIKKKLCTLDADTKVYPGHGPVTTIGKEKSLNQYLQ